MAHSAFPRLGTVTLSNLNSAWSRLNAVSSFFLGATCRWIRCSHVRRHRRDVPFCRQASLTQEEERVGKSVCLHFGTKQEFTSTTCGLRVLASVNYKVTVTLKREKELSMFCFSLRLLTTLCENFVRTFKRKVLVLHFAGSNQGLGWQYCAGDFVSTIRIIQRL